jgi:PAS domain S-box-containing protein
MFEQKSVAKTRAVMLGIAVAAFFFGKIYFDISSDHALAISNAEQHARGLASALNEHALRTFNGTEGAIDSVIQRILAAHGTGLPDEKALHQILAGYQVPGSVIATLFVASPAGTLQAISTEYPVRPVQVADREYFQHHNNNRDATLFISKPFRNRLDNHWLVTASKRLSNPDGSLRMIVGVSIRTQYFSSFYSTLEMGPKDRILLIRLDGAILSLEPFSEKLLHTDFSTSQLLRKEVVHAPSSGTYRAEKTPVDGTDRIVSYRSAPAYPVVAVVSLDRQQHLKQWRTRATRELAGAGLFSVLVAALALLIRSQLTSLRQANERLSRKQSELVEARKGSQEVINSIDGIVWEFNLAAFRFTFVSERCASITGFSSADWLFDPHLWLSRVHRDDKSWADWFAQGEGAHTGDASFEYRFLCKDGSLIWLRDIVTVVTEADHPTRLRGVTLDITQAKKAEAALHEYREAVECSGDMVSVVDRDYRYLVANRALLDFLQVQQEDLVGQTLEQALGAAQFRELKPYLDDCLSGKAVSFELRVPFPGCGFRDLSIAFSPVEESGVVSRVACVARDTTESKRAEQALRDGEERYRRISNAITDYIYTVRIGDDMDLSTWHGPGCLAVTGYTEEEFGANQSLWLKMVADEDRDAVWRHAMALVTRGETEAIEHRIIRKDGQLRWVRNTPVLRFDEAGRLTEYEGLIQDITEKKVAEEALRHSELRFRELLENIQLASMILDTDGKVTFCNDFLLQLTGWSRAETIGADWFDLFLPPNGRAQVRTVFEQGIASGEIPAHYENPIITREGDLLSISWDNTVLHHADGSLAGIASIGMDMTQHRALEEQLRQSQKMEATGLLAGGIAHDFNNILTVIIGYCSIMQMRMEPEDPNRASVDQVLSSAERAAGLTRSLLAFSRKQVMNPLQVDLNAIVRHVEHFLCRVIGEDITLKAELHEEELYVLVDSGQIEQILMNLATNARDAMPGGGILSVTTQSVTLDLASAGNGSCPPGRYALLSVSDNGTGMDEDTKSKIFEPFFTTKEIGKGTGLGLAMAYGTVMQHNGRISVESEPGKGTTFQVYLPLVAYQAPPPRPEVSPFEPHTGHELILVAEDEPAVRELVEGILTRFGYRVVLANDGEEAVAKFRTHMADIELVLLDMIMPKMSGKAAFDEISKLKPGIKAIFTSGYTADVIRSKGELGPDMELVMKPAHPLLLLRKVRELLDR